MINVRKLSVFFICIFLSFRFAIGAAAKSPPLRVFLADRERLAEAKRRLERGDPRLKPSLKKLLREADRALGAGPFSVMQKKMVPPSGDKHDYMSVGPYWWPDPSKPEGKPFIRRDGEVNPLRNTYDNVPLGKMRSSVNTLSLAFYFSGKEAYAEHATRLVRTWFLDPETRMNPNLEFGQAIPGRCDGRGIGIIDTSGLPTLCDSVGLLRDSAAWTPRDQKALQDWFRKYLHWLRTSSHGRYESKTRNNHATWYDVQVASFALFTGQVDVAREVLEAVGMRRIATQITPDGRQPLELRRTKSFDYSVGNLRGMFELARLAEHVGVDLWHFETEGDGRSIRGALDWLIPYAVENKKWPAKQIKRLRPSKFFPLLRRAAAAYREPRYEMMISRLPGVDPADRIHLFWPPEF